MRLIKQVWQRATVLSFCWLLNLICPQAVKAEFTTQQKCLGYRVFDVNDRTVNLRNSPNGRIVKTVPNGTLVNDPYPETPSIPPDKKWMPVVFQSQTFYVSTPLLYREIYLVFDRADSVVNFRQQPNGTVLKALPNETEVAFIESKGEWTLVRLSTGEQGYVFSKFLKEPSCF